MRKLRLVLWSLVGVALFLAGALSVGWFVARDGAGTPAAGLLPGGPLGGPFALVDQKGAPVTEQLFRDKPAAVMFGYTHCPDVCPTTLMEMSGWAEALGPDADRMRFVFVTVDPERDTPETMNEYVSAFSDRIIGVTGEPEAVRAMLRDYKIPFNKAPVEANAGGGDYGMDHLSSVVLLDREGAFVGTIASNEARDTAMAKLKSLVAG